MVSPFRMGGDATPIGQLGQDKLYLELASKQGYCENLRVELRFR